jgi:predicted nucleic-acid-binding protein
LKSVDTNILVRFILGDDPDQSPKAEAIVAQGVSVPITVLLELGWVLSTRYAFDRNRLAATLSALLDTPGIAIADEPTIRHALAAHADGADFADAIHLVSARGSDAFLTFDRGVKAEYGLGIDVEQAG